MVKITNGINIFEVTKGAYEGIFSRQGYKLFEKTKPVIEVNKEPELTEDELFCKEIVEKPISNWNKDEVKRFAELNEIDISDTKNANEAKDRIKTFLEEQ